jgi:hypothetical protein
MAAGLRGMSPLPKQVRPGRKQGMEMENVVPRWLVILSIVAVLALIAGFVTFGGGNMGR